MLSGLGRAHVRDGVVTIKTEKSGFMVAVTLPILPALAATLAASPCGDLTFVGGESGRAADEEFLGNEFRKACRAAGVRGSAHGVRRSGGYAGGRERRDRRPGSRRSSAGMVAAWPRCRAT